MAENEKKAVGESAPKEKAPKKDKPSVFSRLGSWFRSLKSESKKISWANWSSVRKNTVIVIVCVVILSALLGIVDFMLSNAVVGLSRIF